ncbi:hypothetical protein AS156_12710 [Bradyrhizobium macuxiense]|uniref:Periplasmic protein-like protein n=1 Tax=Bradyrhizobium macuxiense TaxID=1755647 RepID=A0A109JM77_9BRAD|nr:hypothetical protein [Bradyrhizobium macuxiense]KWV51435.1 hypothetical protein AS156_12710 [Bradyrhizobium macuxiense]
MLTRILFLLALLLIPGALRAEQSPAEKAGFAPKLTIYLAKGRANACGAGCDRWIAVEGEIDRDAAPRIRRFLAGVKDMQLPIYLHSPGGNVEQSYAIARLLRARKATARIGRTIVTACSGTQVDAECLNIKAARGEVAAELATRNAMCNSACGYLFLGATTREVAPDAAMGVHNSRLTFVIHGHPPPQAVAQYRQRQMVTADRDRAVFITAMGIGSELNDLIRTVKFESVHVLTRPELYRFGIDTRPMPETQWTLEKDVRPFIRKIALQKKGDGAAFRLLEWRLFCENKDRARLMFVREFDETAASKSTVTIAAGADKSAAFGRSPVRIGKYEVWSDPVAADTLKAMLAVPHLQVGETTSTPDGKSDLTAFDIDTSGLEPAWTQLQDSCPAVTSTPKPTGSLPAGASSSVSAAPPSP